MTGHCEAPWLNCYIITALCCSWKLVVWHSGVHCHYMYTSVEKIWWLLSSTLPLGGGKTQSPPPLGGNRTLLSFNSLQIQGKKTCMLAYTHREHVQYHRIHVPSHHWLVLTQSTGARRGTQRSVLLSPHGPITVTQSSIQESVHIPSTSLGNVDPTWPFTYRDMAELTELCNHSHHPIREQSIWDPKVRESCHASMDTCTQCSSSHRQSISVSQNAFQHLCSQLKLSYTVW